MTISVGTLMSYTYRKEIKKVKNELKRKSSFNTSVISSPLTDKISKNPSEFIYGLDLSHH